MKNIRINIKSTSLDINKIKKIIDSFSTQKHKVSFKVYDYSLLDQSDANMRLMLGLDLFSYKKMPYEDYAKTNDLIMKESKEDGVEIASILSDRISFNGNLDEIVDSFDSTTGSVYSDHISNGIYFYLKSPPVKNMTAALMFVNLLKMNSDTNIVESIFSSHASRHIPKGYCSVENE